MEYTLRRNIAKYKYDLELCSLKLFELTTHLTNMKRENQSEYAIDIAKNNIDKVKIEIERYKIELKELNSKLK